MVKGALRIMISDIDFSVDTQSRVDTYEDHVLALSDLVEEGIEIDPIRVYRTPLHKNSPFLFTLIDGYHRVAAHERAAKEEIIAYVLEVTEEEAFILSLRANIEHKGRPLTREDRVYACKKASFYVKDRMVTDGEKYPQISSEVVAEMTGCPLRFAARVVERINAMTRRDRDHALAEEVARGRRYEDIARDFNVSKSTVGKAHKKRIDEQQYEMGRENGWERERNRLRERTPLGFLVKKEVVGESKYRHRSGTPSLKVEADLIAYLVQLLKLPTHLEKNCLLGRVDIVTEDEIIEVKKDLSLENIKSTIGQIHMYSFSFPGKSKVIAGKYHLDFERLQEELKNTDISVIAIHEDGTLTRSYSHSRKPVQPNIKS